MNNWNTLKTGHHPCIRNRQEERGFTRTDLVAVIVGIGIVALVVLPVLAGDRDSSRSFQCLSNLRQLMNAWQMYSTDNSDKIVRTAGLSALVTDPNDPSAQPGGFKSQWVLGRADDQYMSITPDFIRNGLLYPYVNSLSAYKCPADEKVAAGNVPTVRSVSMNAWMNPINTESLLNPAHVIFRGQPDIRSPASTWVLIDEAPYSINDGWFLVRPDSMYAWYDLPAAYHREAAGIAFADTHVETKQWTDRGVLHGPGAPGTTRKDHDSDDLWWLIERTTYPQ